MNDVYEISPLEGGKSGGLARVATIRKELLAENPNTITLLSGDFLSPSLIGMLKDENGEKIAGRQMVEALNAVGLDYVTFGNHEFDLKTAELLQKRIDQSDFKYVCSNAFRKYENGKIEPFTHKGEPVPPYVIETFTNASGKQVRVGITGVVLPFNKQPYVSYTAYEPALETAAKEMSSKSDVMVAITHLALDEDIEMAKKNQDYLVFFGGHDHVNMKHQIGNTLITKADANAKTVYIHRFSYNQSSGKTTVKTELKTIDDSIADDVETQKIVRSWEQKVGGIIENMGYNPDNEILVTKTPLICTESKIRSEPTNFGILTAKAFEKVMPDADAFLLNSGSMRLDDNLNGVITEYDILRVYPYGGPITSVAMSGETLEKVLTIGLETNRGEGGYFQTWKVGKSPDGKWLINKKPINSTKTYKVMMPEFLASGKEANLEMLGDLKREAFDSFAVNGKTIGNDVRDIVVYYMTELKVFK
jgi:5'-nucleotidase